MSSQTKQLLVMAAIFIVVIALLVWLGGDSGGSSGGYTAPAPQPAQPAPAPATETVEAADLEAAAEAAAEEAAAQIEEDQQNAADAVTQALEEQSQQIDAIADLEVELDPEQAAADAAAAAQGGLVGLDAGENQIADQATEQATTVQDLFDQAEIPADAPQPIEPENAVISSTAYTASLEIRCDTLLANIDDLASEKQAIVPADGLVLAAKQITFYEGESVFNVLERELKQAAIHLEFVNTPFYNSAYIEGIANLYEFDCGEGSGWVYQVNDWFPNYGASRYQLQDGDTIIWYYTCDLGLDVGRGL